MCLIINENIKKPRRGKIRWKFLRESLSGKLTSPYSTFSWNKNGVKNIAVCGYAQSSQTGFHVYTQRRHAERAARNWHCPERLHNVVVKLRVDKFISAGIIDGCDAYSDGKYGEIWNEATVLAVYPVKK